ncbi:MAG TPA: hypothetical protein VEB19_00970 [Gemmatimonadaceae bacterium]|nr:hypothetical protein [Gemmatimonadaceae bacterium]
MPRRSLLTRTGLLAAIATVSLSCSDVVQRGAGLARIAFEPHFAAHDAAILRSLRTFNLGVTSLHVTLRRPNQTQSIADTTVTVADDQTEIPVVIDVPIVGSEEFFIANLEMFSGDVLIFSGTVNVLAKAGADPTTARPQLQLVWVGPGSQATRVVISPRDQNLGAINGTLPMTAQAFDAAGNVVDDPDFIARFRWNVDDPTLGTLPRAGGTFTALGKAGVAIVSVLTPNLLRDTVRLTLQSVLPVAKVDFARKLEIVDRGTTAAPVPVSATDPNNTPVTTATLSYISRDPAVATVNASTGAITGVARGQTVVVVRAQEGQNVAEDSLLAVIAEPGAPVLVSSVDRFTYARDANVTITVFMDMRSTTRRLGSTTVDVDWNPQQLLFQSTSPGGSSVVPTLNVSQAASGRLTLAMADVTGFPGRVELLRINFRTSNTATAGTLALSAREVSAADFTDLLGTTTQVTHSIRVP